MQSKSDAPAGVARFALSRGEAAFMAGVSVGTFDKMVDARVLPAPRSFGSRKFWLRPEIESALLELPAGEDSETERFDWR